MGKKRVSKVLQSQAGQRPSVGNVATKVTRGSSGQIVIPCLADPLEHVLHLRNEHGRVRKVLTVDQFLHHKRYKGKKTGVLTARGPSGTVYTLPVKPALAATPADTFRTAGATA